MIALWLFFSCSDPPEQKTNPGEQFLSCWPDASSIPIPKEITTPKNTDFFVLDLKSQRLMSYKDGKILIKESVLFCFHLSLTVKTTSGWGIISNPQGSLQVRKNNETLHIDTDLKKKHISIQKDAYLNITKILNSPQHILILSE
jgi:hypothetical protein